jgi:hypothetical protein
VRELLLRMGLVCLELVLVFRECRCRCRCGCESRGGDLTTPYGNLQIQHKMWCIAVEFYGIWTHGSSAISRSERGIMQTEGYCYVVFLWAHARHLDRKKRTNTSSPPFSFLRDILRIYHITQSGIPNPSKMRNLATPLLSGHISIRDPNTPY